MEKFFFPLIQIYGEDVSKWSGTFGDKSVGNCSRKHTFNDSDFAGMDKVHLYENWVPGTEGITSVESYSEPALLHFHGDESALSRDDRSPCTGLKGSLNGLMSMKIV